MEYLIEVALCAACISYTITWAGIFEWLRKFVSKFGEWFDELFHCPYCFSHYVVLIIMLTTQDISDKLIHITNYVLYNFLFTWFTIVCLVSLLHCIMLIAYKPVAEVEAFRKLKNKRNSRTGE